MKANNESVFNSTSNVKDRIARVAKAGVLSLVVFSLTGCYLTSPYWGQSFDDRTGSIDFQAWTTDNSKAVSFQCAKATHYGLYGSSPVWTAFASVSPAGPGSFDTNPNSDGHNMRVYSVARRTAVPSSCWHYDGVYDKWVTAIRAKQGSYAPKGFNADGLECLGREIGKARSWLGALGKGCAMSYSNSNNDIPYTRILATN